MVERVVRGTIQCQFESDQRYGKAIGRLLCSFADTTSMRTWSDEKFIEATKTSQSVSMALRYLGLQPTGGNFKSFRLHAERLGLSLEHMTGQSWSKGKTITWPKGQDLVYILIDNSTYTNLTSLKSRLLRAGLIKNVCALCKIPPVWLELPLYLQLDHISGNSRDHRLQNLRLLCPNCHSQTATYCGRNKNKSD